MDMAYAAADIIVSRAGALSVSELCIVGKAAILVPSPSVAEDHQTKNALALSEKSAAILVKDIEANHALIPAILSLAKDVQARHDLATHIAGLSIKDADERIYQCILSVTKPS
jgi:UDP-N-acetylglucosamine--N-acetylmuramyl-(pentapeptide) pyrophosphoryl-undecaprenol N-acetylglucosamine transferase